MSAGGPRLVYDATAPARPPAPSPPHPAAGRARIALLVAVVLGALFFGLFELRRADQLEARVGELDAALAGARAEIAARRQHLDAIRASVGDLRERVDALEALSKSEPAVPVVPPPAAPPH